MIIEIEYMFLCLEIRILSSDSDFSDLSTYSIMYIIMETWLHFSHTRKFAYLSGNPWLHDFSYCRYTYIIIEIEYMFSNWKQAYYLETCLQINILLNKYIIMEIEYMFLCLEIRILSSKFTTNFLIRNKLKISKHVCRLAYS